MGTLTRSELVTEVSAFFADRDDISTARYITWLNIAQQRIARVHNFEELEGLNTSLSTSYTGTPADDKFVTLPSTVRKIHDIRLIDGSESRKLQGFLYKEFDKRIPYPEKYATGKPSIYTKWAGKLELWKIPDAAYDLDIRITAWPTAFNASSDVASDLDEKDDALIMLAVSWGYLSLRNMEDANKFWAIYKNMLNDIVGEDIEQPSIELVGDTMDEAGIPSQYWKDPFVHDID